MNRRLRLSLKKLLLSLNRNMKKMQCFLPERNCRPEQNPCRNLFRCRYLSRYPSP